MGEFVKVAKTDEIHPGQARLIDVSGMCCQEPAIVAWLVAAMMRLSDGSCSTICRDAADFSDVVAQASLRADAVELVVALPWGHLKRRAWTRRSVYRPATITPRGTPANGP